MTEEQQKELVHLYKDEYKSLIYCAKQFHTYPAKIKQELLQLNVRIRNHAEANIITNKGRAVYSCQTDFFQTQSSDMAWLLGFLAADGCVRKNSNEIKIGLARVDREILERIQSLLKVTAPIKDYTTKNGYDCSCLKWTCEQHKKDLARYSVIPEKTLKLRPPYALKREYWTDYIRGYFDGDGSVSLIKGSNCRGNGSLRWQVCAAIPNILQWILDFFEEEYNIPPVKIYTQKRVNTLYYFQYSSAATRKIYKVLYNSSSHMFLQRKKKHFEEILAVVKPLKDE